MGKFLKGITFPGIPDEYIIESDAALSDSSENSIQNKAVTKELIPIKNEVFSYSAPRVITNSVSKESNYSSGETTNWGSAFSISAKRVIIQPKFENYIGGYSVKHYKIDSGVVETGSKLTLISNIDIDSKNKPFELFDINKNDVYIINSDCGIAYGSITNLTPDIFSSLVYTVDGSENRLNKFNTPNYCLMCDITIYDSIYSNISKALINSNESISIAKDLKNDIELIDKTLFYNESNTYDKYTPDNLASKGYRWCIKFSKKYPRIEFTPRLISNDTYTVEEWVLEEDNSTRFLNSKKYKGNETFIVENYDPTRIFAIINDKGNQWTYSTGLPFSQLGYIDSSTFKDVMSGCLDGTYKIFEKKSDKSVGHFLGKRWVVFGDSLTEKNYRAKYGYYDYIADELGIKVLNYGDSGTGYKSREDQQTAFYQRIATLNPKDFDVITIFGSGNDLSYPLGNPTDSGTETICGCMNKTIDEYYKVAPYTPIGIVTPCPWNSYNPSNPGNAMEKYSDALMEISKRRGIPCLDLYHCSGLRPWDPDFRVKYYLEGKEQDSGIHPNTEGHKVYLYPQFREFLKKLLY